MTKRVLWVFGALLLSACSGVPELKPGATEFVTEEPTYGGGRSNGEGTNAATPGAGDTLGTPPAPGAPSGRTGTVEEADIYRIDQNRLFYFNTYRGFLVYDLGDTKNPKLISRLPVYGYPVEMYVEGNTVYALLRDALYMTQEAGQARFTRHDTSQLVTIDVSDAAHPKVLKTIDIIGKLREGVSRKIDDTIYVVSSIPQNYYGWWYYDWGWYGAIDTTKEQAWVYSFNVANATDPVLVDKLQIFEGGGAYAGNSNSSSSRYFQNVAISATSNTLHVVENWQTYGWVSNSPYNCGSSYSQQEAVVSIIDISDPSGHIRLHTKFDTYGNLSDQFKMTYVFDAPTQKGYFYGIFERQEWASSNCSGSQFVQNDFEAWDITNGASPQRLASLPFGKPGETVGGSTFDPDRKVAFAITSRQVDPFYAIGFSDPAHPQVLSAVDGLAGDMSVFRFIGDKKFILGIGRDNSASCTGFDGSRVGSGVSVSIFDVQKLDAIRLVQRRCVDVQGADFTSSEVNWNLDQGHKMIGQFSDATANVVTVPVSYYKRTDEQSWWWYRYSSAVGLLSWDLAAYDPTKSELEQNVLVTHGAVDHDNGAVRRTIVFAHDDGSGPRRMLLNLSDTYLSLFDLQNLDQPVAQSELEVAPDVEELFRYGNHLVEHVRTEGYAYGYDTKSEFRIKPVGGDVNATAAVASFSVGQVQRVMKWKNALVVFRRKADPAAANGLYPGYYDNQQSQIVVFDMADPTQPKLASITDLPYSIYPYYRFWCGNDLGYFGGWWWGNANDWVSFDGGLAFNYTTYSYDPGSQTSSQSARIVFVNLADLGAPAVKESLVSTSDSRQLLALTADASDPSGFFLTYRDRIDVIVPWFSGQTLAHYKYYAQRYRLEGGNLETDQATNVPGQIVRSWKSGGRTLLVTQDNRYTWVANPNSSGDGYYEADPRLHLLERLDGSTASLIDSHLFDDRQLSSLVGGGDRLYVTTTKAYRYYYDAPVAGGTSSTSNTAQTSDDQLDNLVVFDASQSLQPAFDATLGLTGTAAMGASGNRLFLQVGGAGVLVLDASQAAQPVGRSFLRTLGWGSHLEFSGDTLYVAAGNFGVFQRDLAAATLGR